MRVFISGGNVTLQAALAEIYTDRQSAERIARAAGLDVTHVAWSPRMDDTWHSLVEEARRQHLLYDLAAVALREYPHHVPLRLAADEALPTLSGGWSATGPAGWMCRRWQRPATNVLPTRGPHS